MSTAFLALVAQDIKKRFGLELSDIAIVFNNKRPITYLKKHLANEYGHAIWSPQFFTIQEFLGRATDDEQASPLTQFFYLYQLHNELLREEGREPETLEEFYPIAEIILSDFGQLDYDLVNVDHIYMELYDIAKIDLEFQHLTPEQQEFIRKFWQAFSMQGHTGLQERFLRLWKRLPKLYRAFKQKLNDNRQTNYPTVYRKLAEGILDAASLTAPFKKVLFVGFNALSAAEVKLFKQWQEEDKALFYFDVDAYYLEDNQQEAGLFIRRNIFHHGLHNALGDTPNIIGSRKDDIHVYAATGKVSQTKLLYDVLQKHEQEGKTSAVLLADETLLVPLLQSLPDIKVNITTGFPLTQSPIYGILDLWMNVHERISHQKKTKVAYQDIETFLNNPLTKVNPTEKTKNLNFIAERQLLEVALDDISIKTSVLPNFFRPLASSKEVIPTLTHMVELLLQSLSLDQHIKQIDATLLIETQKVLNQLHLGFEKIPDLSILFQIGLIRKAIAPIASAIEGDPLEGLQIMGLLESRCLNFDNIYILGANEGILPKTSGTPTFIPNNLRRAYGLPILENQDALSAYLFYRHLQYSSEIHIFYNSVVDESSSGEESRFLKQLEFESNFTFVKKQQQQPVLFPPKEGELMIPKKGKVWQSMRKKYIDGKAKISATALTTYLHSPLQFFLKHVAEIKEPPRIAQEFEMNLLGTIIHNVMEAIYKPFKGVEDFISTQILLEKIKEIDSLILLQIAKEYAMEIKEVRELNSLQRILHKIAYEYIKMYLEYDIKHFQSFRIIELENDEDYEISIPIQVEGKEEMLKIYGIIDRVDQVVTSDGVVKTRIVDYKTGADSVSFTSIEKVFGPNTENKAMVQTMFYAYVFEQKTGIQHLEPNLYVARKMREEGTLFSGKKGTVLTEEFLVEQKSNFVQFLKRTLEELFNPEVPFRHNPEVHVYPSDPYTLFYRNAVKEEYDIQ